jgi:predicted nucleic acid-binding protein
VRALCAEADALGVSVLVVPELISTLCRLVREGRLSSENYQSLKAAVQTDLSDADLCDLSQEAFEQALRCLERHPLRTLDALHVGSALVYQPELFVSADRRQAEAADREGLAVMDLSL